MMDINRENVILRTEKGEKEWEWEAFSKFVESPFFFHLYFDPRSFFLVPTDAFETNEAKQEARRIIKENIRNKKQTPPFEKGGLR